MSKDIQSIINFWFAECEPKQWYVKDPAFDDTIRARFGNLVEQALAGKLDEWGQTPEGCMALILLLDQFTRNIYRDTPDAFAGDAKAVAICLNCRDQGYLDQFDLPWRQFTLMPLMHSEDIKIQDAAQVLFERYTSPAIIDYAIKHRDIIVKFRRYPHRNAILGRPSTPEEIEFLSGPGSSF